jgi:threonine aldolase
MHIIDYRSDSVTQPTEEMRRAMYSAEVGYDVFGDDPTVNRLEAMMAERTGKEAGLFIPTGTMGNQLSVLSWTGRGEEIILSYDSHILEFEVGAAPVLSSVGYRAVYSPDSILRRGDIEKAIRPYPEDIHVPRTSLVCLENALGRGAVVPLELMAEAYSTAKEHGLAVHTDGARVFNAAAALKVDVSEIAKYTDSLAIHLSKGLCAPVGGVLVGPGEFIKKARRYRHMLGGGMSQSGILAAAGIVALEKMTGRLWQDHENARYLAKCLSEFPGITIDESRADINLVFFKWSGVSESFLAELPAEMLAEGIKISSGAGGNFRFALHNDITKEDVDFTVDTIRRLYDQAQ